MHRVLTGRERLPEPSHGRDETRALRAQLRRGGAPLRLPLPMAAVALIALLMVMPSAAGRAASEGSVLGAVHPSVATIYNRTYSSSVDGFPLSYAEVLPTGYSSAKAYPLVIYLHGEGSSANWVRGGSGNGLTNTVKQTSANGLTIRAFLQNASSHGFIVMAPSPRSSNGFYTNSVCGGPQMQDTLDALHHEQALRNISSIYVLGFSMGSLAGLSLAGNNPGLVKGLAVAGSITDAFELLAYQPKAKTGLNSIVCGNLPSSGNTTSIALYQTLSVLRFDVGNFSGTKIWMSAGGKDASVPNNPRFWPFQQANDTMITSTCHVGTTMNEPANCTVPLSTLTASNPSQYSYRFVYEASGGHVLQQLDLSDIFSYWLGSVGTGCYDANFPPTVLTSCP